MFSKSEKHVELYMCVWMGMYTYVYSHAHTYLRLQPLSCETTKRDFG